MPARPVVQNRYRREAVNLQPYGNTITVETPSDNPFERARTVEIHTQMSGGMAGPDAQQRSRKLSIRPSTNSSMRAGAVPAIVLRAPAHRDFMPGMGDLGVDPAPAAPQTLAQSLTQGVTSLAQAGAGILTQQQQAKIAAANAKKSQADAAAAQTQLNLSQMYANMGQHKAISIPLILLGGGALVTALILFLRKKKR